jgi:NADPH2:quinone reductase
MRAIEIPARGAPPRLAEIDEPSLRPGTVRIRVAYAAVNNIDRLLAAGALPGLPEPPLVPGLELSGIVEAAGDGVTGLAPGQRVAYMGGLATAAYAEKVLAEARYVVPVPDGLGLDSAAAVIVNYVTAQGLLEDMARVRAGNMALVHGAAGGVGTALLQLARRRQLRTIALIGHGDKAAYVRAQGAGEVIDRQADDVAEQVRSLTGGRGVDVSFNMAGGDTLARDLGLLAPFGQVICFGFEAGLPTPELATALAGGFGRSVGVRVSDLFTVYEEQPALFLNRASEMLTLAATGQISPHIDRLFDLADAGAAHAHLAAGRVRGKVLLRC